MKFLANGNFPMPSYSLLDKNGMEIIHIGLVAPGEDDEQVMIRSIKENRIILTFDSDYGGMIFKYGLKPEPGIVYFRLKNYQAEEPARILLQIIKSPVNFNNRITVIDKHTIRQRKYQ
ncbi:MAG: DUF5615 family PIN-like protein [Bacteroidota bacterium]